MKTISSIEKLFVLAALCTLMLKVFDLCSGIILFYSWTALAAYYLFFSHWVFFQGRHKFNLLSIFIGIGFSCLLLGWTPRAFGWPFQFPFFEIGVLLLTGSLIYQFWIRSICQKKHKIITGTLTKKRKLLSRTLIFGVIASFLSLTPKDIVFSLLARNNFDLKLFTLVGQLKRDGKVEEALAVMKRNFKSGADADMYRLYGEVLLANGDTAGALSKYRGSLLRDTFEHANSIALTEIISLTRTDGQGTFNQNKFGSKVISSEFKPLDLKDDWETATSESQSISNKILQEKFEKGEQISQLVSLIVIKNDKIIAERYYQYSPIHLNCTFSVWKSIVSIMMGVAIDKGFVKSVEQKLPEFLPNYPYQDNDPRKEIRVKDLLTMTSGITGNDYGDYYMSKDPLKLILQNPIDGKRGQHFRYLSQNMIMAIKIIESSSGMKFDEFCHKFCDSLNILRFYYPDSLLASYNKNTHEVISPFSWDGTYLTLRDMAKFGLLFLHKGKIKNDQIISESWMNTATRKQIDFADKHIKIETPVDDYTGYGYFFWLKMIEGHSVYAARGWGGQTIVCVPDKNLVVASFGSEWDRTGGKDIENLVFELTEALCK